MENVLNETNTLKDNLNKIISIIETKISKNSDEEILKKRREIESLNHLNFIKSLKKQLEVKSINGKDIYCLYNENFENIKIENG